MAERYNGWTNYETWNVALWLGNDQGTSSYWDEAAQEVYDGAEADDINTREEDATHTLAAMLQESIEDEWEAIKEAAGSVVHLSSSMWADLMGAALCEVNWHEIAEHYIEETDKAAVNAE